jgi:hypothetical protein
MVVGKEASTICSEKFGPGVEALRKEENHRTVASAALSLCWNLDDELLESRKTAGTTLVFVWIEDRKVTLGWCDFEDQHG